MTAIEIEDLRKEFGATVALDDVSVSIDSGEFVVVMGISGSGKSTLLRCLNGLTTPTAGEARIDDQRVTRPRDDVAMIFQQHNIIDQLSAYSNTLTGALGRTGLARSLLRLYSDEDKYRALEALETVGLLDEARQRTSQMSGGQQQRVGIARALVQQPDVLLADEPVASLDPGSAQEVMKYLRQATHERDLTTLVSLHQVNLARKFGERFIGLQDGQVVFDGTSDEFDMDAIDQIYGDIDTKGMFDTPTDSGDDAEPTETGQRSASGDAAAPTMSPDGEVSR
jgi:phosphonate transport system ATP-binding protein